MEKPDEKQQILHATAVAIGHHGILLMGPSGSGKSDLAIQLIDRGATLISDDQVIVKRENNLIVLDAPSKIAGKIELYSVGICDIPFISHVPLSMIVSLKNDSDRYPFDNSSLQILSIDIPMITINGQRSSAPIKIEMALRRTENMEPPT